MKVEQQEPLELIFLQMRKSKPKGDTFLLQVTRRPELKSSLPRGLLQYSVFYTLLVDTATICLHFFSNYPNTRWRWGWEGGNPFAVIKQP